jgi:hypothetical protein
MHRDESAENLRVIYKELAAYNQTVVGFRFQLLGFFLAAVGFIVSHQSRASAALLLALAIGLWLVELKNRLLLNRTGERAGEIEALLGHAGFVSVLGEKVSSKGPDVLHGMEPRWLCFATHTLGLDLVYSAVASYSIYVLAGGPVA